MHFLNPKKQSRREMKRRIKAYLIDQSSPRFQALLITIFVGASVFGAAAFCLWLGLKSMPFRYAIAVSWGYFMFYIALEWLVKYHLYRERFNEDLMDEVSEADFEVDGQNYTGGVSGSDAGDFFDFSFDLDDGIVIIIPLILVAGALFISFYFVWVAPAFIAEILLDAFLMGVLYNKLKKIKSRTWLETVFQKTIWIYILVLVIVILAGLFMQSLRPDVVTMGDLFS